VSLKDELLAEAIARRERLDHPPGGHTSSELDILSEPASRALAIAMIQAEAEEARRVAEAAEIEAQWWASLIVAAETENRHRDAIELARARRAARIAKADLKADLVQQTEPRLIKPTPKLRDVIKAVSEFYGVPVIDIISQRKTARVMRPRQVFCYLARIITTRSFPEIGRHLGNRDHTSILHSFNKIAILAATDEKLARDVDAIRRTLEGA